MSELLYEVYQDVTFAAMGQILLSIMADNTN